MSSRLVYILFLLLGCCQVLHAQRFDALTVQAMIEDHKRIRGPIQQRAAMEVLNKELHKDTKEDLLSYKDINEELDKYTRCFDILDVIVNSLSLVTNVYNTVTDIRDKIQSTKQLLERYRACVIVKQRGQIERAADIISGVTDISSISGAVDWYKDAKDLYEEGTVIQPEDTIIITIGKNLISEVGVKCEEIYKGMTTLLLYATGVTACSTENFVTTIQGLDGQFSDLRKIVDNAHFLLWRYIHMRTGYWSKHIAYQHHSNGRHANRALERWHKASHGKVKNS